MARKQTTKELNIRLGKLINKDSIMNERIVNKLKRKIKRLSDKEELHDR